MALLDAAGSALRVGMSPVGRAFLRFQSDYRRPAAIMAFCLVC